MNTVTKIHQEAWTALPPLPTPCHPQDWHFFFKPAALHISCIPTYLYSCKTLGWYVRPWLGVACAGTSKFLFAGQTRWPRTPPPPPPTLREACCRLPLWPECYDPRRRDTHPLFVPQIFNQLFVERFSVLPVKTSFHASGLERIKDAAKEKSFCLILSWFLELFTESNMMGERRD